MNKYMEMMYQHTAEGHGCKFCSAVNDFDRWFRKQFPGQQGGNSDVYLGCIVCPHAEYAGMEFRLHEGYVVLIEDVGDGETCTEAGKRVWRAYRDYFEFEPSDPRALLWKTLIFD